MSFALRLIGRAAKGALGMARDSLDPDRIVQLGMSGLIEAARVRHESDPMPPWREGEPLKLLLAGYVGTRNTGADVRVEEMVRQFRHLFGDDHLDLSICTIDPSLTRGYFQDRQAAPHPADLPQVPLRHGARAAAA
ncbi:MAG: hypothetical protein M5U28_21030 [Sandaracinaceae bacterium]|nr:hypothetical protein [Sandaracinaceae bacterium]